MGDGLLVSCDVDGRTELTTADPGSDEWTCNSLIDYNKLFCCP